MQCSHTGNLSLNQLYLIFFVPKHPFLDSRHSFHNAGYSFLVKKDLEKCQRHSSVVKDSEKPQWGRVVLMLWIHSTPPGFTFSVAPYCSSWGTRQFMHILRPTCSSTGALCKTSPELAPWCQSLLFPPLPSLGEPSRPLPQATCSHSWPRPAQVCHQWALPLLSESLKPALAQCSPEPSLSLQLWPRLQCPQPPAKAEP